MKACEEEGLTAKGSINKGKLLTKGAPTTVTLRGHRFPHWNFFPIPSTVSSRWDWSDTSPNTSLFGECEVSRDETTGHGGRAGITPADVPSPSFYHGISMKDFRAQIKSMFRRCAQSIYLLQRSELVNRLSTQRYSGGIVMGSTFLPRCDGLWQSPSAPFWPCVV